MNKRNHFSYKHKGISLSIDISFASVVYGCIKLIILTFGHWSIK